MSLQQFLTDENVRYTTPESADFDSLRSGFTGRHDDRTPILIVHPVDKQQVAAIVEKCQQNKISVTVRSGGHDMFGRFVANGAVCIDLRALKTIKVAEDRKTVTFDGGCTCIDVLEALDAYKLHTPYGNCGTIGLTSWATYGGVGPLINSYGFGSDQIVSLTVVDSQGKLVKATDEMLRVFRGGGAFFGVIVDVTIKVYPMDQIHVAGIAYESSDIATTIETFYKNYNKMLSENTAPNALHITPAILRHPLLGVTQLVNFVWNGPATDQMYVWFDRVVGLAKPMLSPGQEARDLLNATSSIDFIKASTAQLPVTINGKGQSSAISTFSEEAISCLAKAFTEQPDGSNIVVNMHILRSDSPSCSKSHPDSVLPYRKPRIIIELLPFAQDPETGEKTSAWALEVQNRFQRVDAFIPQIYLPLSPPENADPAVIYGNDFKIITEAKVKYDPQNIFAHTIPRVK